LPGDGAAIEFADLLRQSYIPTYSAVVYRAGLAPRFPEWHRSLACGDWALHLLHAEHGPFGFLPDVMTVYRQHGAGMWSSLDDVRRFQQIMAAWAAFDVHYEGRYSQLIAAARDAYIAREMPRMQDLRRIERRYHALQLDHIAAAVKWCRTAPARWLGRLGMKK
jgi:hypothetical protein